MAAAIDRHVYIAVHEPFEDKIILKYGQTELVTSVDDIRHPILREAMARAPTATILSARTATASAYGCAGSAVKILALT